MRLATLLRFGFWLGLLPARSASVEWPDGSRPPRAPAESSAPSGPRVVTPATLRGRVVLPDAGSPLGLRAYLSTPSRLDSADIDIAGAFAFSLRRGDCDSVDIRIDATDIARRRYHPASLRVAVTHADAGDGESIQVLLVPRVFTIEGGTYAGTSVPIEVDLAVAGVRERSRYWRVSRSTTAAGVPIGWREDEFPLALAVTGRLAPMRTADSVALWSVARQLERDFGRTLFRPIATDSSESERWSVTVSLDPSEESPGITFITYDGRGDVYEATVTIRTASLLSDSRVVTHELLHVLGFGHSVGWYSVMGGPFQSSPRATASDVAYAQLFYRLRQMHADQRVTHGILASTRDARRFVPPAGCALSDPPPHASGHD